MKYHAHSTDLQTKLDAVTIDPSKTYTPDWGPSLKQLEKSFAKLSQAMQDNTLRYVFLGPRYGKSYTLARLQAAYVSSVVIRGKADERRSRA